jgi:hypothetical protein
MMSLFDALEEVKSPNFICTSGIWEDFVEGHLWRDFQKELECWLVDTWAQLEVTTDPEDAAQLRGRARTLREVMNLPGQVIFMIQQKQDEED